MRLAINSTYTRPPPLDTFAYAIIGEVVAAALPISVSPTVDIARDPNGDVRITFAGTLQSSTNVDGTFEDVAGNPPGLYVVPVAAQLPQQYFRAWSN